MAITFFNQPLSMGRAGGLGAESVFGFGNRGFYASGEEDGNACLPFPFV
jgi:hypothetical protein